MKPNNNLSTFLSTALLFFATNLPAQQIDKTKGLRDYYQDYFPIGVAVTPEQVKDPVQSQMIRRQFNSLTAENAMKMGPLHPQEHRYFWNDADTIVNFAVNNGLKVRGHALCWHNQAPAWMFTDKDGKQVSKEVLLERLREHIHTVVGRYKGRVYAWDVVNEAVSDNPKEMLRNSLWYQICGEEFISKAFEYAHEADPNAVLFYNDYSTESPGKRQRIFQLLKSLLDKKIPVHAIGLQGHWSINYPSPELLGQTIEQFAGLGLKVQVTEMDVSVYANDKEKQVVAGLTPELDKRQSEQYQKLFGTLRKFKDSITGVTFWNLSDRASWLDNFPVRGRKDYPLLFDKELKPKQAYWKIVDF